MLTLPKSEYIYAIINCLREAIKIEKKCDICYISHPISLSFWHHKEKLWSKFFFPLEKVKILTKLLRIITKLCDAVLSQQICWSSEFRPTLATLTWILDDFGHISQLSVLYFKFNHLNEIHSQLSCRKTHLLTINSQMGIDANGFNYWYHNNMLGPYRDWANEGSDSIIQVLADFSHLRIRLDRWHFGSSIDGTFKGLQPSDMCIKTHFLFSFLVPF